MTEDAQADPEHKTAASAPPEASPEAGPDAAPAARPEPVSPGALLQRAREAKGLTPEQVSSQTMLSRATVEALENNDFERLSQPVFVRGYYRKCAKVLGLPEDEVMAAYARFSGEAAPRPAAAAHVDVIPQDVTPGPRRAFLYLLLAVIALGAFAWLILPQWAGDTPAEPAAPADAPLAAAGTVVPDPAPAATSESTPAPAPAVAAADQNRSAPALTQDDPAAPAAQADAAATAPAPPDAAAQASAALEGSKLLLRFEERSWIRVTDASDTELLEGIIGGGNLRVVDGRPPYRVELGYAPGVSVSIGGRTVYTGEQYAADNTASFTVTRDGSIQ